MKKPKREMQMLRVELEPALIAKLKEFARKDVRTVTAVVRLALREYLDKAA